MHTANLPPPGTDTADAARVRAVTLVADNLAELMRFWNFKPSMGRIWAVLYLSRDPLDAEQIEQLCGLSAGQVSTTLTELQNWGVVRQGGRAGKRRVYEAETDILAMVARVFRERELVLVERSVRQLEEALALLAGDGLGTTPESVMHTRFVATRVERLLALARTGQAIVQQLARAGNVDLSGLRDALSERMRDRVGTVVSRALGRPA